MHDRAPSSHRRAGFSAASEESRSGRGMWHRSSFCDTTTCVEVQLGDQILIRDSKDPRSPMLSYSRDEWRAFIEGVRAGEFDLAD